MIDLTWFKEKYFYDGANSRFDTFQLALTLLNERFESPTIIETGCQRQKDDVGAGMSTSIFAEYIHRYDGSLYVIDNTQRHLNIAYQCTAEWHDTIDINFWCSDSAVWLKQYKGKCSLLYLDSYDYPIGQMWDKYGGKQDLEKAMKIIDSKSKDELLTEFGNIIAPCQQHCLNEFTAVEEQLDEKSIVLVDDNNLPGGGKPGLLKPYLEKQGWKCLLDSQQTLWIKEQ